MGIHHFFYWLKTNHPQCMENVKYKTTLETEIDTLLLDMNGIIHNAAQKVYKYGEWKPKTYLKKPENAKSEHDQSLNPGSLERATFREVCFQIDSLIKTAQPKKRLILCIDGPAPLAKQQQQRMRRYKSVKDLDITSDKPMLFNPNCITPGTVFMDRLSQYIDFFIRKKMNTEPYWRNLHIIFSNEKQPGEGEHKAMSYVRQYATNDEVFCINGMDADLVMLTLATQHENFYILRDDKYFSDNAFHLIDISKLRAIILNDIGWESENHEFDEKSGINDFICFIFLCGNDFLPHIPSIEIIQDGIELIIEIYKSVCSEYGHLTKIKSDNTVQIRLTSVSHFFEMLGATEKDILEQKINSPANFFKDSYLEDCCVKFVLEDEEVKEEKISVDIHKYINGYHERYFPDNFSMEQICHAYIEGIQWVLSYYTSDVPSWKWLFPFQYAPPASVLARYTQTFKFVTYRQDNPSKPFEQLLCVIPPKSANLLPQSMRQLLTEEKSMIKQFCPCDFEIDYSGKRKEYQGIPLLPIVDFRLVEKAHKKHMDELDSHEKKRNITGCAFEYKIIPHETKTFKCFYGIIENSSVKSSKFFL
jgi:5'-3' exoribonuclease 1